MIVKELGGSVLVPHSIAEVKTKAKRLKTANPEPLEIQRFIMPNRTLNVSIKQILRFLIKLVVALILALYC